LEQKSPWKAAAYSPDDSQIGYHRKREGSEEGHIGKHLQRENVLIFETDRKSLVGGEAELAVLGGEVWAHAHTESVVGRLGRGVTNRADRVWEGRGVGIVWVVGYKGLHVRSRGKERLIPRGVRDSRISERNQRISGNNLGHCMGEGATLRRATLRLIYTKVLS
jgi:hypothetical protein